MNSSALLELQDASFGYAHPIIQGVSLVVERGDFIALIGPNGSGKTTLFKGMLGLLPPLSGGVVRSPSLQHRIGYVPQRDRLDEIYPLTAYDIVRMGAVARFPWYRIPSRDIHQRVNQCLQRVGMSEYGRQIFSTLSGGQFQRVLIARALATEPQLLVLDEPTAGIDPVAEAKVLDLLAALHREGMTILMVSHQLRDLRAYVNRAAVIRNGRVLMGTAAEMLSPERMIELLTPAQ